MALLWDVHLTTDVPVMWPRAVDIIDGYKLKPWKSCSTSSGTTIQEDDSVHFKIYITLIPLSWSLVCLGKKLLIISHIYQGWNSPILFACHISWHAQHKPCVSNPVKFFFPLFFHLIRRQKGVVSTANRKWYLESSHVIQIKSSAHKHTLIV